MSLIGLGSFSFSKLSQSEVFNILESYFKNGGDLIDTGFYYGESQKIIGDFLKSNTQLNYSLSGKIGYFKNEKDYRDKSKIKDQFYTIVDRLNAVPQYVFIHEIDWKVWFQTGNIAEKIDSKFSFQETIVYRTLIELKNLYKFKFGFSSNDTNSIYNYLDDYQNSVDVIQIAKQYDLFVRPFNDLKPILDNNNIEYWLACPFHQGDIFELFNKNVKSNESIFRDGLKKIINGSTRNLIDTAIGFISKTTNAKYVITGADNPTQIWENLMAIRSEFVTKDIIDFLLSYKPKKYKAKINKIIYENLF